MIDSRVENEAVQRFMEVVRMTLARRETRGGAKLVEASFTHYDNATDLAPTMHLWVATQCSMREAWLRLDHFSYAGKRRPGEGPPSQVAATFSALATEAGIGAPLFRIGDRRPLLRRRMWTGRNLDSEYMKERLWAAHRAAVLGGFR